MRVDKLFFEAQSDRYFLILKAAGKQENKTVFFNIGNLYDENVMFGLFMKNESSRKFWDQLGVKVEKVRIMKKVNAADSSEVTVRIGIYKKVIKVSTMEAVRISSENDLPIEIPSDMAQADKFGMLEKAQSFNGVRDNLFSSKFIEREDFSGSEVVM